MYVQEETELKIQQSLNFKNLVPNPKSFMGNFFFEEEETWRSSLYIPLIKTPEVSVFT